MLNLVRPVVDLLKIKPIDIYNNVFKLHSKVTVVLLLIFSVFVSAHEYFGTPIDCITNKDKKFVNSICWINGTYTIPRYNEKLAISYGVSSEFVKHENRVYQRYYQWIVIVLIIQAVMFYMPAFIWKIWEHGRIKQLCKNLDEPLVPDDYVQTKKRIIQYLLMDNKEAHNIYAIRFFTCEAMNFLVVIANMYLLQFIFSGFWFEYAPAISALFNKSWKQWSQCSAVIFPKLAKCEFHSFGASGTPQLLDAMCLLPLNILNEKIFAFEWIWIIFLFFVSSLNLVYRVLIIICCGFRVQLLRSLALPLTRKQIRLVTNDSNIGDWFLLYQLGRNINPYVFREIMEELAELKKNQKNHCDPYT